MQPGRHQVQAWRPMVGGCPACQGRQVMEQQAPGTAGLQEPVRGHLQRRQKDIGIWSSGAELPCWETRVFLKPLKGSKQVRVITPVIWPTKEATAMQRQPLVHIIPLKINFYSPSISYHHSINADEALLVCQAPCWDGFWGRPSSWTGAPKEH